MEVRHGSNDGRRGPPGGPDGPGGRRRPAGRSGRRRAPAKPDPVHPHPGGTFMTTTGTTFDLAALGRTVQERDAAGRLAFYADDAVIEIVDREHPPSAPLRYSGVEEIRGYVEDVA